MQIQQTLALLLSPYALDYRHMAVTLRVKTDMYWGDCARELGRALSRYNGLTNSAKLDLITDVVTGGLFDQRAFCYAYQVINKFKDTVKPRSAEVHLQHAIAFGFLHRTTSSGKMFIPGIKSKLEANSHIALTPMGRALCIAQRWDGVDKEKFSQFIWDYALLKCDFDMYALLLAMTNEKGGKIVTKDEFYGMFCKLCADKVEWLQKGIPAHSHRQQVQSHISWIEKLLSSKPDEKGNHQVFTGRTPDHHFNQRKKWAKRWKHLDETGTCLTPEGEKLAQRLPPLSAEPFFWLGPSEECANTRIISALSIPKCMYSPAWNLLRPESKPSAPDEKMVSDITHYMLDTFDLIRLGNFNQAPLSAVVPYLYFMEHCSGQRVNEHELFRSVLKAHREKISGLLQPNIARSYYHLK